MLLLLQSLVIRMASDRALSDWRESLEGFNRPPRTEVEQRTHALIGKEQQRRASARERTRYQP